MKKSLGNAEVKEELGLGVEDVKHDFKKEIVKYEKNEEKNGIVLLNGSGSGTGSGLGSGVGTDLWKRVCGVDQIRRVVEHLGDHSQDQELRNNLVTSLLADRKVPDSAGKECSLIFCVAF